MSKENNNHFKTNEIYVLTNLLPCITKPAHQNFLNEKVDLIKESIPMDKPK